MGLPLVALLSFLVAQPAGTAAPAAPPDAGAVRPDRAHLEELLAAARQARLWEDPGWLRLGHWRRATPFRWKSEVDGPAFFRSLRGKQDPRAELEATLRGLFDDRPVADELSDAQCRFPARHAFLARRLAIDPARLPPRACPRRDEFLARSAARAVTLVFSSYYLNNPASAFGHTFLRLDKGEGATRATKAQELLDIGVNYAAAAPGSGGVLWALEGLLGFFPGVFSELAYYYKVREYADAESRDLWEYELALSEDEVSLLVAHLWELGSTWFDYWYLDENCSYQILGVLDAVAPRLELLSHLGPVVIPADTVKALFANAGLVRAVRYRPSVRAQFRARVARLDAPARALVVALGADPAAPPPEGLPAPQLAAALDAAVDAVDLRHFRALTIGGAPEAARARQVLLERRSALRVQGEPLDLGPTPDRAPHAGHGSARAGAGGGWSSRLGGLALLDTRLALHDLGDPPDGYPPLSEIEFFKARLRLAPREGKAELDEGWLIRVVSLNGMDRFDLRPSWRLRVGGATISDPGCPGCLAASAELGTGFCLANLAGRVELYGGGDVSVEWSPRLAGAGARESEVRAGLGVGGLLRVRATSRLVLLGDARWRFLPEARPRETFDVRATVRLHVTRDLSIGLEERRTPSARESLALLLAQY